MKVMNGSFLRVSVAPRVIKPIIREACDYLQLQRPCLVGADDDQHQWNGVLVPFVAFFCCSSVCKLCETARASASDTSNYRWFYQPARRSPRLKLQDFIILFTPLSPPSLCRVPLDALLSTLVVAHTICDGNKSYAVFRNNATQRKFSSRW